MFDCSKYIKECKASCCGPVPFNRKWYQRMKKFKQRKAEYIAEGGDTIILTDKKGNCIFLKGNSCAIYNKRPPICRMFGTEYHLILRCPYQDKDGNPRTPEEKEKILKTQSDQVDQTLKRNAANPNQ